MFACVLCVYIPFKTTLLNVELNEPRCVKRRETYFKDKLFAAATTQKIFSFFCSVANSMLYLNPVVTMKLAAEEMMRIVVYEEVNSLIFVFVFRVLKVVTRKG